MRIGGDDTIETYALGNLPGQTLEDNFWLDTYRDELGINVVYDWIVKGDDEYSQKINITIATGELPDIMSVTATQMVQLAEADLIADISDVYEAYAADFTKETLTQEGDDPFLGIWRGNPRPFNDRVVHIGSLVNKIFQNNEIRSNIVQSSSIRYLLPTLL